ncbi:citrate synthase [Thermosporothrix hazakensis]|uniref:Citrate synthase n=3 Tax=Thermosporothrix TaxID=768650 RepID=A0A326U1E5_THEHA|nr:citrate synthase [Thermosporothrix hazakensis]PZW24683.1 citrate synthase [Thermosporothrix hazakensis]BBH90335.1 citrate synthase 1 [Thermosporothrix sp. COM3]GCE48371.1 citrate synthase 1 [Thermosporothrix hazakensis]
MSPSMSEHNSPQPGSTAQSAKGGLEGIVAATTGISKVEGQTGRLIYRGYNIHDLARSTTYEEVAYLLWFGRLPNAQELKQLKEQFAAERTIPEEVMTILEALPAATAPMDALRTAVSAWGAVAIQGTPTIDQAIALTARFPVFLATFERLRKGKKPLTPLAELGHAANYLYMLTGQIPSEEHVRGLNSYLVLLADHGMNASTFTGRIVASTESDIASAVVAAIGALKGPLHGGAPALVQDMLREIGSVENAESWIRNAITSGKKLMGFGHRVYKTTDPRAEELREMARVADPDSFKMARTVEELALAILQELKPGRKLYTNVEYYSAALMASVGLSGDMFTPTFAVSRVAGWTAHILEQVSNNRLIRPEAEYTGPMDLHFVPLEQRS